MRSWGLGEGMPKQVGRPFKMCGMEQLTLELPRMMVLWAVAILGVEVVPVLSPKPYSHFVFVPRGLG